MPHSATSPSRRATVEVTRAGAGRFNVRGRLTFATARQAVEVGLRAFGGDSGSTIEVDLGEVSAGDSAGLAVLLQWLAWARRRSVALSFVRIPESIRAMARISEIESLLTHEAAARDAPHPGP